MKRAPYYNMGACCGRGAWRDESSCEELAQQLLASPGCIEVTPSPTEAEAHWAVCAHCNQVAVALIQRARDPHPRIHIRDTDGFTSFSGFHVDTPGNHTINSEHHIFFIALDPKTRTYKLAVSPDGRLSSSGSDQ